MSSLDDMIYPHSPLQKELFLAIYFSDLEKLVEIKEKHPEIYAQKRDFPIHNEMNFDLSNLTWFNQVVWLDDDWSEESMPLVLKYRRRTEQLLCFWKEELEHYEPWDRTRYNRYWDYFILTDIDDPENENHIDSVPLSSFIAKGIPEMEAMLHYRISRFEFDEVEQLLQQGADPTVELPDDDPDDSSTFGLVGSSIFHTVNCRFFPTVRRFEMVGYNQPPDVDENFGELIDLAANTEMYDLLDKYRPPEKTSDNH